MLSKRESMLKILITISELHQEISITCQSPGIEEASLLTHTYEWTLASDKVTKSVPTSTL